MNLLILQCLSEVSRVHATFRSYFRLEFKLLLLYLLNGLKERVLQSLFWSDSLGVIELKHSVEQIKGRVIMNFANLAPLNFLLLHLVRD